METFPLLRRGNIITGTQHLNSVLMSQYENLLRKYLASHKGCPVLYRVTPVYSGTDLLAFGVEIEVLSLGGAEDGLSLHVFCRNVQPGIEIDFATGESQRVKG